MSDALQPTPATAADLRAQLVALRPAQGLSEDALEQLYTLGFAWLQTSEFVKARAAFDTLWRCRPDEARYAAGLGHSALGQGQADEALTYFLLAVGLDEDNAGYMMGLGRAFMATGLPGHAGLALGLAQAMTDETKAHDISAMASACLRLMEPSS